MINSNYYGFDTLREHPTHSQSARAANITYAALTFRRMVERQQIKPVGIPLIVVDLFFRYAVESVESINFIFYCFFYI